jgi:hypothetical protein
MGISAIASVKNSSLFVLSCSPLFGDVKSCLSKEFKRILYLFCYLYLPRYFSNFCFKSDNIKELALA